MGVMSCSRAKCDNIMCQRYHSDYGYICEECFVDLKLFKPKTGKEIIEFMDTPKKEMRKVENLEDIFSKS